MARDSNLGSLDHILKLIINLKSYLKMAIRANCDHRFSSKMWLLRNNFGKPLIWKKLNSCGYWSR